MSTREAVFAARTLTWRCRYMNVNVYACVIDYHKDFDCVNHNKLINILKNMPIDKNDLRIISHLY